MERGDLRVLALRTPVFHEFVEFVVRAGFSFRAAPKTIGGSVIVLLQQLHELADAGFLLAIVQAGVYSDRAGNRDCNRRHDALSPLYALLMPFIVAVQIAL